ncbi:hypothetical protein [Cellulophaga baltica]|uniref:Sensor of ECF-type sigma factor n=2 Tax=Cellulophaga baltica TaxID=76594 RepID=A0A1G7KBX7_9FLAO|nr:hypothetical protein [Cellulophaga baltica]AIY14947.1 hypothetical protein M667_18240 [Cellulophaga baltica NN016038]AIZ43318.1 hypothetical protein M666_18240 [Cellulophaga baltica 18]WFO16230.1 hypothetical protein M601_021750 [Cellulophaga baltica 4]SDF34530.1 hypothetical protein SAMN04487992_11236 [Cellulophaga baltica]
MNNLKNIIPILLLMLTVSLSFGQRNGDWDKIRTLKIAFITERLDLSSKEAQTFWPIYNEYQAKREDLHEKGHTEIRKKLDASDNLSENDSAKLLDKYLQFEKEEEELEQTYLKKIQKVISAKKTLLLIRSEGDFKRKLIKQYRDKHKNNK